jgi:uncharacterized repeat protein (TIGR03803 family)
MKPAFLAVILLIANSAQAGSTFKVLHSFQCNPSGCYPSGGLAFDAGGELYGTTFGGGNSNATIFRLTPSASDRWTYDLLYTLTIKQGDALLAGLTLDAAGNLYGTADYGGAHDVGSVFSLSPDPSVAGGWILSVLHSFLNSHQDGSGPWDKVILDKAGNLYGTTREGGTNGGGILFTLTPGAGGEWTEAILHNFPATKDDGGQSYAELVRDKFGSLYGTTSGGGTGNGDGTVFKLTHTTSGWKETLLHSFQGPDGSQPIAGLVFDAKGNLYGTTQVGGANGEGTVFQLTPTTDGRWKHSILYDFPQFRNGGGPVSTLAFDKSGNLYGTAAGGTGPCSGGCGVVYKLTPDSDGKWTYSVLHRFTDKGDGAEPNGAVVFDKTRTHLYGTAIFGGTYNQGVVYEITP